MSIKAKVALVVVFAFAGVGGFVLLRTPTPTEENYLLCWILNDSPSRHGLKEVPTQQRAFEALDKLGMGAIPLVNKAMQDDKTMRVGYRHLGSPCTDRAIVALGRLWQHQNAIALLIDIWLKDENSEVKLQAKKTILAMADKSANVASAVGSCLRRSVSVRAEVAFALAEMGTNASPALPAIRDFLETPSNDDEAAQLTLIRALSVLDPGGEKTLMSVVKFVENGTGKDVPKDAVSYIAKQIPRGSSIWHVLVKGLQSADPSVCDIAVAGLIKEGASEPSVILKVVPLLQSAEKAIVVEASKVVDGIGSLSLPILKKHLTTGDAEQRIQCLEAMTILGERAASVFDAIVPLLEHADQQVRVKATLVLPVIGAPVQKIFPVLTGALQKKDDEPLQRAAVKSLHEIGNRASPAVPALLEVLKTTNSDLLQCEIVEVLPKIDNSEPVLHALLRSLQSPIGKVQIAAIRSLGELGQEAAVSPLLERLENQDTQPEVIQALVKIGPKSLPALFKMTEVGEEPSQTAAIIAMGKFGSIAVDPLVSLVDHKNPVLRKQAVASLGEIGEPAMRALPKLSKLLWGNSPEVQVATAEAIVRIDLKIVFAKSDVQKLFSDPHLRSWTIRQLAERLGKRFGVAFNDLKNRPNQFREMGDAWRKTDDPFLKLENWAAALVEAWVMEKNDWELLATLVKIMSSDDSAGTIPGELTPLAKAVIPRLIELLNEPDGLALKKGDIIAFQKGSSAESVGENTGALPQAPGFSRHGSGVQRGAEE